MSELFKDIVRELIDPGTIESVCLNNPPVIINEGLITTYPIDRAISAFAKVYNLKIVKDKNEAYKKINDIIKNGTDENGVITILNGRILMILGEGEYNKKVAEHYMEKYGYSLSYTADYLNGWQIYFFDKKIDEDITEIVKNIGFVYHICNSKLKDKILRQGLVPKESKWKKFKNGPRCYFFVSLGEKELNQWVYNFKMNKAEYNDKYILLKIDVSKLPEDIKFYYDPRMNNGTYTLQGISPQAIKIEKEDIEGEPV